MVQSPMKSNSSENLQDFVPTPMASIHDIHIEVSLKLDCECSEVLLREEIIAAAREMGSFINGMPNLHLGQIKGVDKVTVYEDSADHARLVMIEKDVNVKVHLYKLSAEEPAAEQIGESEEDAGVVGSHHWPLPHKKYSGLWERLIFDSTVKYELLGNIWKSLLFSQHCLDEDSSRLILLHGPPGTGKTSLCKSLAQKISIRMSTTFPDGGQLVEINSHSLFSKWFSESGKLVQKMFSSIEDLAKNPRCLVVVLIDEVESLTSARSQMGNEPSDAVRVVNAVLTQMDKLQGYPNVLLLATSNLFASLDDAFISRAELIYYLGLPPAPVIFEILRNKINELITAGLVTSKAGMIPSMAAQLGYAHEAHRTKLFDAAEKCVGLAGRNLKRLPKKAYPLMEYSVPLENLYEGIVQSALAELASLQKRIKSPSQ